MDSKCFEIERVMEGTGNLIENRFTLSFPLGLVLGWGAPYSFVLYFYPVRFFVCLFVLKLCFVVFEKAYSMPFHHHSPGRLIKAGSGAS